MMANTGLTKKRYARDVALRTLFGQATGGNASETYMTDMIIEDLSEQEQKLVSMDESDKAFVNELVGGVTGHVDEIDEAISRNSPDWKLSRMSRIDLCILRLGVYELMYSDTPDRVCINEAVELAKKYGSDKAPPFVNGILGRVYKMQNVECRMQNGNAKRAGEQARGEAPEPKRN